MAASITTATGTDDCRSIGRLPMIVRCRKCGKNNRIELEQTVFRCENCDALFDRHKSDLKVIEPKPATQSDPLADFR